MQITGQKKKKKDTLIFYDYRKGKIKSFNFALLPPHPFCSNSDLSLLKVNKYLWILMEGEKSLWKQDKDNLMNM